MKVTHQQGDPRTLTLLQENARYMRHETFALLVSNIKRDGVLQQWPFVYHNEATGERHVLSGNHRVMASIEAGLDIIDWTECDTELTKDQQTQIQLSHNSITGEDDPDMLKRLFDSIGDVDERIASGLDDDKLDLLFASTTGSLSEVNLDFMSLLIVFLPHELERAVSAFEEAKKLFASEKQYLGRYEQYPRVMAAIEDAREASHVINMATALDVLLEVWDQNRDKLRDYWLDKDGELIHAPTNTVPLTSIFGMMVKGKLGQQLVQTIEKMIASGEAKTPEDVLSIWVNNHNTKT